MSQVSLTFPDSTYSTSNKPSTTTLKTDLAAIETGLNDIDSNAVLKDGSVSVTGNITTSATPSSATHVATMGAIYPVGAVFLSVVSTNPATLLGFGTWSQVAGGQMICGQTSGDADFDTAEETGGAKTATLTTTELPAHTHTGTTASDGAHTHQETYVYQFQTTGWDSIYSFTTVTNPTTGWSSYAMTGEGGDVGNEGALRMNQQKRATDSQGAHTHTFTSASTGTGSAFSIVNPYFVVYAWKRTA